MKGKTNKFTNAIDLYQITGFDMRHYVDLYRDNISEKNVNQSEMFIPMADFNFESGKISQEQYSIAKAEELRREKGQTVHIEQKRGVFKDETKIIAKCMYFQDAIIRRAYSQKDTMSFSLSAAILKSVLGHEYKRILEIFIEMGYLKLGSDFKTDEVKKDNYYTIGEHSTMYTLQCNSIVKGSCADRNIIKYKEKTKTEYEKMKSMAANEVDARYGKSFREHYIISLRKIKIEDEKGLFAYINKETASDSNKLYYYRFVAEALKDKDKTIYRVDNAGRIYHCLTNLERELKGFLNIDFMLDCRNSHPLLFNYFIFLHYNISPVSSYRIMANIKENASYLNEPYFHNVGKNIRKLLIDNNIENGSVALLQDDELEYVYLTGTGQLWDIITSRHPDKDRNEVKVQMFQEVFYSNSPYAYHWKEYAVDFKRQFPSVYAKIGEWKKSRQPKEVKEYLSDRKLNVEKQTAALSIVMMNLEAQIFTTILKRIYAKRWNAIHIHDCIVVPKDCNANHPTIEQVRSIMEDVYKDFGLCPTLA